MTETEVVDAFATWLAHEGWSVMAGPDKWVDIYAERGNERLICEAKGQTKDNGASADILWGQLLRRMGQLGDPGTRYAVVVPEAIKDACLRVPGVVRQRLGVDVYLVGTDGTVRRVAEPDETAAL